MWLVPPHRAVWVPAGVPHAHRAKGPTEMRSLVFAEPVNPLRLDRPTVLTVGALLREVIAALSEGRGEDGLPARGSSPALDRRQRRNLKHVALDRLRRAEELPLALPQPADDRLRTVPSILLENPADPRTAEVPQPHPLGQWAGSRRHRSSAELGLSRRDAWPPAGQSSTTLWSPSVPRRNLTAVRSTSPMPAVGSVIGRPR